MTRIILNAEPISEAIGRVRAQLDALQTLVAAGVPYADSTAPVISPLNGLADEAEFYDFLRDNDLLGPVISPSEFKGCSAITVACAAADYPLSYTAYSLATAYLETAHTMLPVREAYWLSEKAAAAYFHRMYDINGHRPEKARELGNLTPGDGAKFCGRGYPQMTGRGNYVKATAALNVDLVNHPERALEPEIAAKVMVRGMSEGWFTGKKLSTYLPASGPATRKQYTDARRIINGTDRDDDVAGFALDFEAALVAGKWQ